MKASHRESIESIPFVVNGRATAAERRAIDAHINECAECRSELALQQQLHEAMLRSGPTVDHAPGASLQKLWSRIDVETAASTRAARSSAEQARTRSKSFQWLIAAVVVEAIGIVLLALAMLRPAPMTAATAPPAYETVSNSQAAPTKAALRVVFAPGTTMKELNTLLREQRLEIVNGPSSAGVYTLGVTVPANEAHETLSEIANSLRAQSSVRFAEPIGQAALQ